MQEQNIKVMSRASNKPVPESVRLSVEETFRFMVFAGMKSSIDNLIDSLCL